MASASTQRFGEFTRGVLELLSDHPEGLPPREVIARLESLVPPTEFENKDYPGRPGARRYVWSVRFATINAVKAGWLLKGGGHWKITDAGREAFAKHGEPGILYEESRKLYKVWQENRPDQISEADEEDEGGVRGSSLSEEAAETAWAEGERYLRAAKTAWAEVENYLRGMPPYDFQNLVAALLRAMGYHVDWVAPPGRDDGIDIIAYGDPLGARPPRIKVAVRRRSDKAGAEHLRAFTGLLSNEDVGIYVCAGGFTSDAEREARRQETKKVRLLDLEKFYGLWVEHYGKIPEEDQALLPLVAVHFLAPSARHEER